MLNELASSNKVAGVKQSKKAVEAGEAKTAYISNDAEPHIRVPFENLCNLNGVPVIYVETMKELAKACRVDVPTAVAVII